MSDWSKALSPIACDMSVLSPTQRQTHLAMSRELFANVQTIKELPDGYEFQLAEDPGALKKLAEFVSLEKLCCPFLNFAIEVAAEGGPVTLRLSGREGVKAFVREEISGLLGTVINWKQGGEWKSSSHAITLLLIMESLGNIPPFLSALKTVEPDRRRRILVREILIAYVVMLAFLFAGKYILRLLSLQEETVSIAGGIVLFLIALRMVFPRPDATRDTLEGEPFIVPLAIPFIAGPSTLASLLLLQQSTPNATLQLFLALTLAWIVTAVILLSSTILYRLLKEKGLIALERLMGMLLVMLAVQMFINGVAKFMKP